MTILPMPRTLFAIDGEPYWGASTFRIAVTTQHAPTAIAVASLSAQEHAAIYALLSRAAKRISEAAVREAA